VTGDPSFANTVLLCHFDGTNGQVTTTDNSAAARTITRSGSITLSTASAKFGGASTATGTTYGNYWRCADSSDWHFGSGQFVVEAWVYMTSTPSFNTFINQWGTNGFLGWWWGMLNATTMRFYYSTNGTATGTVDGTWSPTLNTWHHVAVERDASNVLRLYVNGAVIGSATVSATFFDAASRLTIAGDDGASLAGFAGYMDELRITKGVARYSGAFSVPTSAFPDTGVTTRRRPVIALCG
jgi:hypothetical protein